MKCGVDAMANAAPRPCAQEGKRSVTVGTLFYMPRCGALLYNNVLWANWGPSLRNVAILGNSFAAYALRHPGRRLAGAVPYVHKVPCKRLDSGNGTLCAQAHVG